MNGWRIELVPFRACPAPVCADHDGSRGFPAIEPGVPATMSRKRSPAVARAVEYRGVIVRRSRPEAISDPSSAAIAGNHAVWNAPPLHNEATQDSVRPRSQGARAVERFRARVGEPRARASMSDGSPSKAVARPARDIVETEAAGRRRGIARHRRSLPRILRSGATITRKISWER